MFRLIAFAVLMLTTTAYAGTPRTVVLDVKNMSCALCPITVKKSLQKVPGVAETRIDFDKKTATVKFDPDKASPAALAKASTDAGYPATPRP